MNDIKWLFFDLGSTLIDERECISWRCKYIIENNGIEAQEFMKKVEECAKTDHFAVKTAASFFGAEIPRWPKELEKLYLDTKNVLEYLASKYKLGIIANQSAGTQERIEKWGIAKYFDVVIASAEAGCAKPDLRIFHMALEQADCLPEEAVMIGDRLDNDIAPAKRIGMKTVWVRQGFAKYQGINNESERPDDIIDDIADLRNVLE